MNLSTTLSKTDISSSIYSQASLRRKSYIVPRASKDFWGTNPYYVVSNRLNHLSYEVKSPFEFQKILTSIKRILNETAEDFEDEKIVKVDDFAVKWIGKYENSVMLLKSIGFDVEGKCLKVIRDVSRMHLLNRVKEISYFFRKTSELGSLAIS
jgi:hypothetical protein